MAAITDAQVESVRALVAAIPPGRVVTYGDIATAAGLSSPRIVGWIMRTDSSDLPWHRVLRASGASAFPDGSAGRAEQCRRLEREGVRVERGRVDLGRHGWSRDLDAVLWGPGAAAARSRKPSPTRARRR